MKNLWRHIPPLRADLFGFREIMKNTDGVGLIDDSTHYHDGSQFGGRHESYHSRSMVSGVLMDHVVSGTAELLLRSFQTLWEEYDPSFALVCHAPAASMIGTDMEDVARSISETYQIPAAFANINGHKTYDFGIETTLSTMARLLVKPAAKKTNNINLIGGSRLDWGSQNVEAIRIWCVEQGLEVCSCWGFGDSKANLERAAEASVNLVLTTAGEKAAKWFQAEFGIPYIVGVPFGQTWSQCLCRGLAEQKQPERSIRGSGRKAVIIGEQLFGNALRFTLQNEYDFSDVRVSSFLGMSKEFMQPEDQRLLSEDMLLDFLAHLDGYTVFAPSVYRHYQPEHCTWISLPCYAFLAPSDGELPVMAGHGLNRCLNSVL